VNVDEPPIAAENASSLPGTSAAAVANSTTSIVANEIRIATHITR
jgi:hypothetical protein